MAWLVEGRWLVYLVLGFAAAVCFFFWLQYRQRTFLAAVGVLLGAAAVYALLDWQVETAPEQIVRKLRQMAAAVATRDTPRIFADVADDFRVGTSGKAAFQAQTERVLRAGQIEEVQVWDIERPRVRERSAEVLFKVKPKGPFTGDVAFYFCKAAFTQEADGQWRLQGFELYPPTGTEPIPLPF